MKIFIEWSTAARDFERCAARIERRLPVEFYLESGVPDRPRAVSIARKNGGCGCSLIEEPTGRASFWQLKPDAANNLAEAVVMLAATAPLTLRAAWLGPDQPSESRETLTFSTLAETLRLGKLVPGRSYVAAA